MARKIDIQYLERRYLALENEIANALLYSPADDLAVADLKYRKLIIADEIEQHRRADQRFDLVYLIFRQLTEYAHILSYDLGSRA